MSEWIKRGKFAKVEPLQFDADGAWAAYVSESRVNILLPSKYGGSQRLTYQDAVALRDWLNAALAQREGTP